MAYGSLSHVLINYNNVLMDIQNSQHRMLGTTPNEALLSRVLCTRVPTHIDPIIVNSSHQVQAKAQMAVDYDSHRV